MNDRLLESSLDHHDLAEHQFSTASAELVRLASFSSCRCDAANCAQDHLAISTADISLDAAKHRAVAISYAWGEFDRLDYPIGHRAGKATETFWMQLGGEWSVDSLVNRLVKLTADGMLCWIDQICVPQMDEQIRQTLSAIPTIFRTLPVIVMFPGSLCKCLQAAYDDYQRHSSTAQESSNSSSTSLSKAARENLWLVLDGGVCMNSNGSCAWTARIWPSQELRYSESVQVLWADKQPAECYGMGVDSDAFEDSKAQGLDSSIYRKVGDVAQSQENVVVRIIKMKNFQFLLDLVLSITFVSPHIMDLSLKRDDICATAEFLLGNAITTAGYTSLTGGDSVHRFILRACMMLSSNLRLATDPRDYILSVWVGWPTYSIPIEFKQMTAWELLADALRQFNFHERIGIPTTCPAGLLREYKLRSATWDVTKRLHCDSISDSRDLYSLFDWPGFFYTTNAHIPFKLLNEPSPSRASEIESFEEWAEGLDLPSIAENFAQCVDTWDAVHHVKFNLKWRMLYTSRGLMECSDKLKTAPNLPAALLQSQDRTLSGEIMLRLVCDILHLDFEVCKRNDVDLMFARRYVRLPLDQEPTSSESREISCIGLVNWQKLRDAWEDGRSVISVALWNEHPERQGPFYEVACIKKESNLYTVIGVWLSLRERHEVIEGCSEAHIPRDRELKGIEGIDGWIV